MTHHDRHEDTGDHTGDAGESSPENAVPRSAEAQDAPEPERPRTPRDSEDQVRNRLEDPPKSEGNRDEAQP